MAILFLYKKKWNWITVQCSFSTKHQVFTSGRIKTRNVEYAWYPKMSYISNTHPVLCSHVNKLVLMPCISRNGSMRVWYVMFQEQLRRQWFIFTIIQTQSSHVGLSYDTRVWWHISAIEWLLYVCIIIHVVWFIWYVLPHNCMKTVWLWCHMFVYMYETFECGVSDWICYSCVCIIKVWCDVKTA